MASAVAKYAAKKMLGKEMEKYRSKPKAEGPYDPYYEMIDHPRKPGQKKKVKKQIPAYIPEHDANVLARARKTAYRLDFALFSFAGIRFGWSSVIGIVPVVGDGADFALSMNLIRNMNKIEGKLPNGLLIRMVINMVLDFLVGLIPFVGDLVDAAVKCNGKNVRILEEHLDEKYKPKKLVDADAKLPKEKRPRPASVYVDFSDEDDERRGAYDDRYDDRHDDVRRPQRAYSGRRDRVPDEEMALPREDTHRSRRDERPSRNNTKTSRR
ncbi:hypothetical protein K458DRAFT_427951 [Lentithecium fluviatile CBS 122367]|uniref:PH domain-containing protein n=1 Tax=Lentithecium fluviatile CBS 122367 TaxID=1168545 RepID=A0A6G1JCT5_9PLEO|nr:hypothetical protein K458DRAFT_427951 [Lentithecium fluviatile CBS 122367]